MKKIILTGALITFGLGVFAQTDSARTKPDADRKKETGTQKRTDSKNDCTVRMEEGKVWMNMDGKTVVMDKEMTLKNGTVVMKDGKVKMKEGKVVQLKEGDCMDNSGNMIVVKNSQIKKTAPAKTSGSKP